MRRDERRCWTWHCWLGKSPVAPKMNARWHVGPAFDPREEEEEEKARFRDLERAYATTHLSRLMDRTAPSMETSSLHIDLISDLKRINSHICSIAYPILESAGALSATRLRESQLAGLDEARR